MCRRSSNPGDRWRCRSTWYCYVPPACTPRPWACGLTSTWHVTGASHLLSARAVESRGGPRGCQPRRAPWKLFLFFRKIVSFFQKNSKNFLTFGSFYPSKFLMTFLLVISTEIKNFTYPLHQVLFRSRKVS